MIPATKNKILRNKLNQRGERLYSENYKTLLREIKDLNKGENFHVHRLLSFNIMWQTDLWIHCNEILNWHFCRNCKVSPNPHGIARDPD